jgi:hypothetical protein
MKEQKREQKPKPQEGENRQRTNTPTGGQQQTPGKAQEDMPPKQNSPRPIDVDEEDEELDPRQRRPA